MSAPRWPRRPAPAAAAGSPIEGRAGSPYASWTTTALQPLAHALACCNAMANQPLGLALVLSGGGARGAYQVGVLRILAREFPQAVPDILTGVSAGGINAAFLASRQEPYQQKVDEMAEMWSNLRIDDVFHVDPRNLGWRAL